MTVTQRLAAVFRPRIFLVTAFALVLATDPTLAQSPYASICEACDSTRTIVHRFPAPDGFTRSDMGGDSYAEYLQHLPLMPIGTDARNWRGQLALTSAEVAAVLDWRLLGSVEQCADIAIRLVAEHARTRGQDRQISFRSLSGQSVAWARWLNGRYTLNENATRIDYTPGGTHAVTNREFDRYLSFVMSYANTASMIRDWLVVSTDSVTIGDVLIQPFPGAYVSGHLSIIVDVCADSAGNRKYLFADGYTPARTPVIRQRIPETPGSAWMTTSEYLDLMSQFGTGRFYRFPGWER